MDIKRISKLKKIIPISFITIFIAALIIPNTGLYRGEKNARLIAQIENRKITPRPTQSLKSKEFYEQFEKWYQDRLRFRNEAISIWKQTNFNLGVMPDPNIFIGKNGNLFDKTHCLHTFSDPIEKIKVIKKLQNYAYKYNKNFIFVIAPSNETIYREYLPQNIEQNLKPADFWYNKVEILLKNNGINYLFLKNGILEYRKSHEEDLYFNDDHHWNYYGAYVGANLILQKLAKDSVINFYSSPDLDILIDRVYKESSYSRRLGLKQNKLTKAPWASAYSKEIYMTDTHINETSKVNQLVSWNVLCTPMQFGEAVITNKGRKDNTNVLILTDSYGGFMGPYITQGVSKTIFTHYRSCFGKKKEVDVEELINKYNPNAIIFMMYEDDFFRQSYEYNFSKIK